MVDGKAVGSIAGGGTAKFQLRALARLREERIGLLLVEQNLEAALAVSDRVLIMEKGAIKVRTPRSALELDTLVDLLGVRRAR